MRMVAVQPITFSCLHSTFVLLCFWLLQQKSNSKICLNCCSFGSDNIYIRFIILKILRIKNELTIEPHTQIVVFAVKAVKDLKCKRCQGNNISRRRTDSYLKFSRHDHVSELVWRVLALWYFEAGHSLIRDVTTSSGQGVFFFVRATKTDQTSRMCWLILGIVVHTQHFVGVTVPRLKCL